MTPSVSDCALGVTGPRRPFLWLGRRVEFPLVFTTLATRPCRRPGKHLPLDALRCQPPPQNRQYGIMAPFRDTTPERSLPPSSPQASDSAAPSLLEQGNLFT